MGSRALRHAERRQRENRRAGVIRQHAGISCRPARVKLRSVEQRSENRSWAHGPYHLGNTVYLREILANKGNESNLVAVFYEVDCAARDFHRFPPANMRVKGASQVILEDLSLVE